MPAAGPILVVEDNDITRKMLRIALTTEGYEVVEAASAADALAKAESVRPRLVLSDLMLPDLDGVALAGKICAFGRPPVIGLTGHNRFSDLATASGYFSDVLFKPVEPSVLIAAVALRLGERKSTPASVGRTVLLVDDDPLQLKLMQLGLNLEGFRTVIARGAEQALALAEAVCPDAVVSDILMPGTDGFKLCLGLRKLKAVERAPILLLSAHYISPADRALALSAGATDCLTRTPSIEPIRARLQKFWDSPPRNNVTPTLPSLEYLACVQHQLDRQHAKLKALDRGRMVRQTLLEAAEDLARALEHRPEREVALTRCLHRILDVAGFPVGAIYLGARGSALELVASVGPRMSEPGLLARGAPRTFSWADPLLEQPICDLLRSAQIESLHTVPLEDGSQRVGLLVIGSGDADRSEPWAGFVQTIGSQLSQALRLARAMQRTTNATDRYRALIDAATEGILLLSQQGVVAEVNPAGVELLGSAPEAVLGKQFEQWIKPEDRGRIGQMFAELTGGNSARAQSVGIERTDGSEARADFSCRAVDFDGKQMVLALARDVTEQERSRGALESSEQRKRELVDNLPDVLATIEHDGQLSFVSAQVEQVIGYTADEVRALPLTYWLARIAPDDLVGLSEKIAGMEPGDPPRSLELRIQRRDERWVCLQVRLWSTHGPAGTLQFRALSRDITASKLLEEELLRAQRMEAVGQLCAGVAHDFNNLLTVILTSGRFLVEDLDHADPRREDAKEIVEAGQRAATLTRQLLAFSRKQPLSIVPLSIDETVLGIEKLLRRTTGENITLELRLGAAPCTVRGDLGQLEQVLMNMVVNARDAIAGRTGRLIIETRIVASGIDAGLGRGDGRTVVLSISDDGCGMTPEVMKRIFEPFFTTKPRERGTGLGLATCYGIVHQLGGQIRVESEPGRGTTFMIALPEALEAPALVAVEKTERPRTGTETILLVEDDVQVRSATARILGSGGYQVLVSTDPDHALDLAKLKADDLALVVSDMVMPGASGPDVFERVRKVAPKARALFISGYSDHDLVARLRSHGPDVLLLKPFSSDALLERVRKAIDEGRAPVS